MSAERSAASPSLAEAVPYERFLDCVHCGLCTSACPTYLQTGDENDNPRGRIHLMRSVADGRLEADEHVRHHLELCLDCRACESACPSGVAYGQIIEPFRAALTRERPQDSSAPPRWWLNMMARPALLRLALLPLRMLLALRAGRLLRVMENSRLVPRLARRMLRQLPPLTAAPALPERLAAHGRQRARVVLFTGCVADVLFRPLHHATARVLQANGCEVLIPRGQQCCGALHHHAGEHDGARAFLKHNEQLLAGMQFDAVVTNVAGCGAMLKERAQEQDDGDSFLHRVRDVSEFLAELGLVAELRERRQRVVYADACHLAHAQGVRDQPRQLLRAIPGLELVDLDETDICCGAAGSYALTQPDMSDALGARKAEQILASGAAAVVTANAGCALQIEASLKERGARLPVLHPMQLVAESLSESSVVKG